MLQKWKFIISNWINCYFNDTKTEECITLKTLLTIISHLHKNLNLDQSKSSILEAQNIEEFILEKYPQFKFVNGTVQPSSEEELYAVASLLLFFVCVNSKDVDIKQAMCSRLSPEDQETIMKFSKSLLECSPVTFGDVQAAIIEACGRDVAASVKPLGATAAETPLAETPLARRSTVAETPPALRSLHGEVRRLQAALDAERFDRNYLQDELARTNLRMEKLLKDKEQFKLEIVNLKAKISLCCGEEAEARGSEATYENAERMTKQLQEIEERLVETQLELDDAQYERDSYKAKIQELKRERDKWLSASQEESSRAEQLAGELELERRRACALQEMVAELTQHHQNNRLDASQLECDDPDASIHSLHNASVCSEACANVIEVQLGEERAKVDVLKQQIQILQEQLLELTQKADSEKLSLESTIAEKDNNISDLKHRINEEVQEKTNLRSYFNEEARKLNCELNELEQKLKQVSESSRTTIEQKMQEIQTLQEEKLSLLQSLADETTKLENVIKDLKVNIDTEKNLKVKMREDYENQMMKLNEKVLNRNNELVELQNKVFEKGEMLEKLNIDLKKEKELNHELSNKHNDEIAKFNEDKINLEHKLRQKSEEAAELQRRLFQNVAVFNELNVEIDDLKAINKELFQKHQEYEKTKENLQAMIQQRDNDLEGIRKEIENITNIFSEEKDKLMQSLEEKSATISALEVRLHDEIQYKVALENELQNLHQAKALLNEEVLKLSKDLSNSKVEVSEKDRMIYALELYLKEERHINVTLKEKNEKLNEEMVKLAEEVASKSSVVKVLEENLFETEKNFKVELRKKDEELESANNKLLSEMEEKEALQVMLMSINEEKEIINNDLVDRCSELEKLQEDYDKLCNASDQNIKVIEALGNKIDNETKKYLQLEIDFDTQTSQLMAKLNEAEKSVKEISSKLRLKVEDREIQIQSLKIEVDNLNKTIENDREVLETVLKEKVALTQKIEEEIAFKNSIEKEYQNQCALLDNISSQLNSEIARKGNIINSLKLELESLLFKADEKSNELKVMETKLMEENKVFGEKEYQKNQEIQKLKSKIDELHTINDDFEEELKKEIASKTQAISALQRENEQLHFTIEEDNSNHEIIIKEKDAMIERLEEDFRILKMSLESLRKEYEDGIFTWERTKIEMQEKMTAKDDTITKLTEQIEELKHCLEHVMIAAEQVREEIKQKNEIIKEKLENGVKMQQQIEAHVADITQYETKLAQLESDNNDLKNQLLHKDAAKDFINREREDLIKQNKQLLEQLHQKKSEFKTLIEGNKSLEEEKTNLTQQLEAENSAKSSAEQELRTLLEAKQNIDHELAEKTAIEKALIEEKNLLIEENKNLSQQILSLEEDKLVLHGEKQITEKKIREKEQETELILNEKEKLLKENLNLSQQMEVIELVKQALLSEKQETEQVLAEKESQIAGLLNEKEQLLNEKKSLSQQLASAETDRQSLLEEKQMIEQQLIEKETLIKALLIEKENLLMEKNSLVEHFECGDQVKAILLAEKQIVEQQLMTKEVTIKGLLEEKEKLSHEREGFSQQIKRLEHDKQTLLSEKQLVQKQVSDNETVHKTLREQAEALQIENNKLSHTLQSVLADKQTVEQQLFKETAIKDNVLKEKENLTKQLQLLKQEKETLLVEKQNALELMDQEIAEKNAIFKEKENLMNILTKEKLSLEQKLNEKITIETTLLTEKQTLERQLGDFRAIVEDKKQASDDKMDSLEDKLKEVETSESELLVVKEYFLKQIEIMEKEKLDLLKEREEIVSNFNSELEQLSQKLYKEQAERQALQKQVSEEAVEKSRLLEVKEYISGKFMEEKSAKEVLEQEKETLQEELRSVEQKLTEEIKLKGKLEEERHYLIHEKNELIEARNQDISILNEQLEERNQEIIKLNELLTQITSTKDQLYEENQNLLSKNSSLSHEIIELNAIKEMLAQDKEVLSVRNEQLLQSLNVEKSSRDELECEKNAVSITLQELNEKYASEIKEKQDQIIHVSAELKQVKMDFKKQENICVHIASVVNSGLDKVLQNIEKDENDNELLQKLVTANGTENLSLSEKCDLLISISNTIYTELALRRNLEKALEHESSAVNKLKEMIDEKEKQALELKSEVKRLEKAVQESQNEIAKQTDIYNTTLESKVKDIQNLQLENKTLNNELNDVKVQLDVKVHSLKEKLIDNENLTDKLKRTFECQIDNLNMMITKLTGYLKEQTNELDMVRKEKEKLQQTIEENKKVIKSLEEEVKSKITNQEKLISDFESERQVMTNMVTVTESIMEDQKVGLNKLITDYEKTIESYQNEKKILEQLVESTQKRGEEIVQEKQCAFDAVFRELTELRKEKEDIVKQYETNIETLNKEISLLNDQIMAQNSATKLLEVQNKALKNEKEQFEKAFLIEKEMLQKEINQLNDEIKEKSNVSEKLQSQNNELNSIVKKLKDDLLCLREKDTELKINKDSLESELLNRIEKIINVLGADTSKNDKFKYNLQEKLQAKKSVQEKIKVLTDEVIDLIKEKNEYISKLDEAKAEAELDEVKAKEEIGKLKSENERLAQVIEENKVVIGNLEQLLKRELDQTLQLRDENASERLHYENRCALLQEYHTKAVKQLKEQDKEIAALKERIRTETNYHNTIEELKEEIVKKDTLIAEIAQGKDEVINTLSNELMKEKSRGEKLQTELESKVALVYELTQKLENVKSRVGVVDTMMKKENEAMVKAFGQQEKLAEVSPERPSSHKLSVKELRDRHQVSSPTSDLTHSSMESFKTINDLETIIHDKNRTITTLQSDITYLKSLTADSENKLLDVTKELEMSKENCEQLSSQLKKLVHQKNEEIADLKKQISKMSVTENRATQIIKVSAKYQAIILKRIAEIKSNTILKELTNFGNTANCDNDLKRNLNSGAITLEDLENFLETTDRHLKRCSEKQLALQKERDRLTEINRINDSEIINIKKFLTELSVSFKTFNSIKDLYTQKLSRVVSMQRTVRREILSLEGKISDSVMCKLERGYAAVMQDLCECSMNLERWVERSIARTISSEKIKQAFTSDTERASLASTSFQNASLEVQLEELENSFQKLLEEAVRAPKGEDARDLQSVTVMEVRAEYEDKLNRMKAKMKQLYQEQIQLFRDKHKDEIVKLENELQKMREKLSESSRAYEEHIKALTTELWNVGEKFLMKKDEAEWLRKKQKSGSLMSLQHVHSTGLTANHEDIVSRPSDTQSLRSLPVVGEQREKREGRGLHMSDEEGEVFDNRWLKELQTPRRESNAGQRLSELRWRNSLCPPHLKSSYPAETQFANTLDEEDIKCADAPRQQQRKEVGITAYKKPGPPTPSKQAGRVSATDSELRESLRVEASSRKSSTPSRLRALFRGRPDTHDLAEIQCQKCDTKYGTDNPICNNENRVSEVVKSDSEVVKCDSQVVKCVEVVKCDTEVEKGDSDTRKRDWFKLSLRQRAALWEPLAKN